jgi:hypothetical protein
MKKREWNVKQVMKKVKKKKKKTYEW